MNKWGVDHFFFHIGPLLSIPSVKPNSTVTDSRGFFRVQQPFPTALPNPPPRRLTALTWSQSTAPHPSTERMCAPWGSMSLPHCFLQGKNTTPNNASHAFTWQPLNRALRPAYKRPHFTPYPSQISPPVYKGQRALKNSTPNDYHRSCSRCQQRESQYNSNFHSVITFAWNFSMSLQLSVSFWICVH